jgi:hypothetical protein
VIALVLTLICALLASVAANFGLYRKWIGSRAALGEANRQLARSEETVVGHQEQLALARVLLLLMSGDWAALRKENDRLRSALEQSERFGVALGVRYSQAKVALAVSEVRLKEREQEIAVVIATVDALARTLAAERSAKARINAIQDFLKRCKDLLRSSPTPA